MKRIGLLSDTHSYLDEQVFNYFDTCDEIWHAGDFGSMEIADRLLAFKQLTGVYGNIDGSDIRSRYPEQKRWLCESVAVYMIHIGGYPGKYAPAVKKELASNPAQLFISGHSHIARIMYDEKLNCLHMNPGAAGKQGWHTVRTLLRFTIDDATIKDCELIELGKKKANG